MPTDSGSQSHHAAAEMDERDIELENILGNLLIAEFQVDKLRCRLAEKISSFYSSIQAKNSSAYSFNVGSKWYRVSVKVEEQELVIEEADKE
jgi:hypothetical protein